MKKIFLYTIVTTVLAVVTINNAKAQDYLLSQPYNNSIAIAPSFAGMTNGGRVALTYRNQWPSINSMKTYATYVVGFDYFLKNFDSGIGGLISHDVQGAGLLNSTDVALQYNYRVKLNRNGLYFRPGVQMKVVHKALDYNKFVFSEDISVDGSIISNTTPFAYDYDSYTKLDAAFSALLYNKYFWAGFNIDHLIPYNASFLNLDNKIPMKFALTAGFNWIYNERRWGGSAEDAITIALLAQHQGEFNQMDIGATWTKSIFQLGFWYRGFVAPVSTLTSRDALIVVAGLGLENFKVSYSYDISLSNLYDASGGSHEISLQFFFDQKERSPMSFFCK